MKTLLITAGLLVAMATVAGAEEPKMIGGCEVKLVPGTNYYNKVDGRCNYNAPDDQVIILPKKS